MKHSQRWYWKGKSKCTCGHLGDGAPSDHLDHLQAGHGPCTVQGCECQQFSWAAWTEDFEAFLKIDLDQGQLFKDKGVLI